MKNPSASFFNAMFVMLVAISTIAVLGPTSISGQTVPQVAVSVQPAAASVYAMSSGRLGALAGGVLGLIGVIIGGLALARPAGRFGTASGRLGANVALAAGL